MQTEHTRRVVCKNHGKVDEYENCLIYCKYLVEIIILYGVRWFNWIRRAWVSECVYRMCWVFERFLHGKSHLLHSPNDIVAQEFAIYRKSNAHRTQSGLVCVSHVLRCAIAIYWNCRTMIIMWHLCISKVPFVAYQIECANANVCGVATHQSKQCRDWAIIHFRTTSLRNHKCNFRLQWKPIRELISRTERCHANCLSSTLCSFVYHR